MKILLKIILFPVTLALSVLVLVLRFLHQASSLALGILSGIFLFAAAGTWVFKLAGNTMFQQYSGMDIIVLFVMAFVCSPYGLPMIAGALVELLDMANGAIKSI